MLYYKPGNVNPCKNMGAFRAGGKFLEGVLQ